jgi:TusE/DsrC/DsvC family sulfur relay protein
MHTHNTNQLDGVMERLTAMQAQMAYLVERQHKQEEMIAEFMPILKEVMGTATQKFDGWEKAGYFRFFSQLGGIGQRVLDNYTAEDVRLLGESVVSILNTVRALTQPPVLGVMGEAAAVLQDTDKVTPLGIMGMVRASKDQDVQKGMAVMMELLRHVGRAAGTLDAVQQASPTTRRRNGLASSTAPRRKALGVERTLPPQVVHHAQPAVAAATGPAEPTVVDGVAFNPDGHLADANAWSRNLAVTLAAAQGVELTDAHWKVVEFARGEFLSTKMSPNIRRITQATGVATKDLYMLFPKAPARTVAKVAGIPKPVGCI